MKGRTWSTRRKRKTLSAISSILIVLSTVSFLLSPVAAQVAGFPDTYDVSWAKSSRFESSEWISSESEYIFGPTVEFDISYLNGTSIVDRTGSVPANRLIVDQSFLVDVVVPRSLLSAGRNVSYIGLTLDHSESVMDEYGASSTAWQCDLFFAYVICLVEDLYLVTGHDVGWAFRSMLWDEPTNECFWNLSLIAPEYEGCSFIQSADYYSVRFQAKLSSTFDLAGTYDVHLLVYDTKKMMLSDSGACGSVALLQPTVDETVSMPDFTAHLTDVNSRRTSVVTPGDYFKFCIDMKTFVDFDNVTVYVQPPVNYYWWDNSTLNTQGIDYKKELIVDEGYYYNTTTESWQTGPHPAYSPYGPSLSDSRPTRAVKLTFDIQTLDFTICEGYYYWVFTSPTADSHCTRLWPELLGMSNFYLLNDEMSGVTDSTRIEFAVEIPLSANCSAGQYDYEVVAYRSNGTEALEMYQWGACWYPIHEKGFSILSANIVKSTILKNSVDEPARWIVPGRYYRPMINVSGDGKLKEVIQKRITNITIVLDQEETWRSWYDEESYNNMRSSFRVYLIHDTIANDTFVEAYNYSALFRVDLESLTETQHYSVEMVNASEYVGLGDDCFTALNDPVTRVLILTFNFTLKEGVPGGYYGWSTAFCNYTIHPVTHDRDVDFLEGMFDYDTIYPCGQNVLVGYTTGYSSIYTLEQRWSTDPLTHALDLDGNNATLNDRYFVKRLYTNTNNHSITGDILTVNVTWGSYLMKSTFGLRSFTWHDEWEEIYVWMHAGNLTVVSSQTFAMVNSTVWDSEGVVIPEYCQLAAFTTNHTWEDIRTRNSVYDWWQEDRTWNWIEVRFEQLYYTEIDNETSNANLNLFFAGILLFNDTNEDGVLNVGFEEGRAVADELTHFFVLGDTGSLAFVTPQAGDSGEVQLAVTEGISWGIALGGINGTTYPVGVGGKDVAGITWWWQECYGTYTEMGAFDEVPSNVRIEDMSFTAHFSIPSEVQEQLTQDDTALVNIKVDEEVGQWSLYDESPTSLVNHSLALALQASTWLESVNVTTYEGTRVTDDISSLVTESYGLSAGGADGSPLATIQMGGFEYAWGKDNENYTMHSSTVPLSAFSGMFSTYSMTGDDNMTVSSCSYLGVNYFVTSCFEYWDGYSVLTDPQFRVYVVAPPGWAIPPVLIGVAVMAIALPVIGIALRRKRRHGAS